MADDRAETGGEGVIRTRLGLDNPCKVILNRVFYRNDFYIRSFYILKEGVERSGLSASGGAGGEEHPGGAMHFFLEAREELAVNAEGIEREFKRARFKDTEHN